jgi:hypothetical protein
VDSDTRRIAIGVGLVAIGLVVVGVSSYYMRRVVIQEVGSGSYCEGSTCFQTIILSTIGSVGGGITALVGVFLALLAVFRKAGKPP